MNAYPSVQLPRGRFPAALSNRSLYAKSRGTHFHVLACQDGPDRGDFAVSALGGFACQPLFWVFRADFSASWRLRGVLEGRCEAHSIVEEDRPRKARKDTETECRPAPTRPDVPPSRTALSAPCVPSVFSVLSVVKFSFFLSGCGFANGKSTGRSFCGIAAWRELPRSFLHQTHQTHEKKAEARES